MATTAMQLPAPRHGDRAQPILSRRMLADGGAVALVTRDDPDARILTEEERRASLAGFMASRPAGNVWVFVYGSLIWNPAIETVERRVAAMPFVRLRYRVERVVPYTPGYVYVLLVRRANP